MYLPVYNFKTVFKRDISKSESETVTKTVWYVHYGLLLIQIYILNITEVHNCPCQMHEITEVNLIMQN